MYVDKTYSDFKKIQETATWQKSGIWRLQIQGLVEIFKTKLELQKLPIYMVDQLPPALMCLVWIPPLFSRMFC